MAFRKHLSGQKGFTLIELLVVVAILGILAGIAAPRVLDAINNARERKAEADLVVIRDALERFYLDYAVFPPNLQWLVEGDYLDPNTTFTNSYNNVYTYVICLDDVNYFMDYRLGDPGRDPDVWTRLAAWDTDGTALPVGTDPDVAPATATSCDYWAGVTALTGPTLPLVEVFTSVTDPTQSVTFNIAALDAILFFDSASAPVPAGADTWAWSYQGAR